MVERFAEVEQEIAAGRLWRAKEMIQGALGAPRFDADLLEKYGQILLMMQDTFEAGRYLLASGRRRPEYREAIELFAARYSDHILQALPTMVRRHSALVAKAVASPDFTTMGYPQDVLDDLANWKPEPNAPPRKEAFANFVMIAIVIVILTVFLVGLVSTVRWLYGALGSLIH